MEKVYLVTSGCYSEYTVDAAFSTFEGAQAYIGIAGDKRDNGDSQIEDYDVDSSWIEISARTVQMRQDGSLVEPVGLPYARQHGIWDRPILREAEEYFFLEYKSYAKTEEGAIKRTNELRSQILALGLWPLYLENWDQRCYELNKSNHSLRKLWRVSEETNAHTS